MGSGQWIVGTHPAVTTWGIFNRFSLKRYISTTYSIPKKPSDFSSKALVRSSGGRYILGSSVAMTSAKVEVREN